VVPAGGPRVDFRDPATGVFLRVDWTATPGSDPVADWRNQSIGFAQRHPGYQEIAIAPATYRDYNAGLWEFRYGDPPVHVANLGFVTGGKGYALYFSAPEDQWAASQPALDQFRQAFQPG
jgi:eukaryotic-like serine/threonine-protein kinase